MFTREELRQLKRTINTSISQNLLAIDKFKDERLEKDYKLLKRVIEEIEKLDLEEFKNEN